ncbi:MAG: HD domain-containing protein [Thermodesulfobacteriota bacterium]
MVFEEVFHPQALQDRALFPLGPQTTGELLAQVAAAGVDDVHGRDHLARVHRLAVRMARDLGADESVVSAAALLHDIGRPEETRRQGAVCHAAIGAAAACRLLPGLGFAPAAVEAVAACIAAHRFRGGPPPLTLEARILYDADKLDSIGAVGIGRAFLFAGRLGARLHNGAQVAVELTRAYSQEDTAYREFTVKLCRVREGMLTPVGRRLADDRHAFMETFFQQLAREIRGE